MRARLSNVFVAILFLCIASCGVQRGKYSNSSHQAYALVPHPGLIEIVRGAGLAAGFSVVGREENLLYVVVVCPGIRGGLSASRNNFGKFSSDYSYTWSTDAGEISANFLWDRQSDTVHIAGVDYHRDAGNTLVLRREPGTGRWSARQLSSIGPQLNAIQALQQVQSQLPNDATITSLAISPKA